MKSVGAKMGKKPFSPVSCIKRRGSHNVFRFDLTQSIRQKGGFKATDTEQFRIALLLEAV